MSRFRNTARLTRSSLLRGLEGSLVGLVRWSTDGLVLACGTGLQEPPAQAAIEAADQIVLVSDAEPSTASLVAEAAELIKRSGVPFYVVVNKMPRSGGQLVSRRALAGGSGRRR